ncbi:MAG: NifB/NifX family molybdenum-iron cluster-binding protein [Desulfuromonadaceae bacterium]|nr:NifB/NifX family molybdenum-iron cluster-binding protein [Desulfuromonadaceae bacterium]MDD2854839.1 NifB/NifX family molybdenum-iron cluster-binding protein [Desulfuromonadaceae bacterium]
MNICFPVEKNDGLTSQIFGHFGSAPMFLVVNTETAELTLINNADQIHNHGACNPVAGLGGKAVDAIVVGGIGGGALHKLNSSGLKVFKAQSGDIARNLELYKNNDLPEYMPGHTCGGHSHASGCSH